MSQRRECGQCEVVGVYDKHGRRRVAARSNEHSIWVEMTGPKGGDAEELTPDRARVLAQLLVTAADKAEGYNR